MNTLKMRIEERSGAFWNGLVSTVQVYQAHIFCVLLLAAWFIMPLISPDGQALVTDGLGQLVLLSLICFLGMVFLSWWLLSRFWLVFNLPSLGGMVSRFNEMDLWRQLGFYWLCYVSLLLAAVGCLIAVL